MTDLNQLLKNNRAWAKAALTHDPEFFQRLTSQQTPEFLWIGCSDSRVPANQIVGLLPGEVFVHRNLANVILPDDANCQAVVQFAVKTLKVRHIIICGHYGCGGVQAAIGGQDLELVDHWVGGIRALYVSKQEQLAAMDKDAAFRRLCELNVLYQLRSLCHTDTLRDAWASGQKVTVHGCIYDIQDGLLHDLKTQVNAATDLLKIDV
jgi:carbonic anhydrase